MTPKSEHRRSAAPALLLVLVVGLMTLILYQRRSAVNPSVGLPGPNAGQAPTASAPPVAGRQWYVGDGYLASAATPLGRRQDEVAAGQSSQLHVFNPGPEVAQVRVGVYRVTGAPSSFRIAVAPEALVTVDLMSRREIPRNEAFWIAIESDRPVFPQLAHSDHRPWDPVPETLEMAMPQPGPADATFTEWVYPDGFQGGTGSWVETETISLLNPGAATGGATLTFLFRDGRRPLTHHVVLGAARVVAVDLGHLFAAGDPHSPPVVSHDYATRVVSDVPIVSQQTRRARWRGTAFAVGSKTGAPIRASESRRAREWYYGGGWIRRLGVLPRNQHDHTWQLLFSYGLDSTASDVQVQAYPNIGSPDRHTYALRPGQADLQWLHEEPWRARLGVDAAWGLRLTSPGALAANVTTAEYEPWSQGLPGAMSSTALVPGPLATEWWMGVSRHGGSDDEPVEWMAAWQFFNPGTAPVRVTVRFHGARPALLERSVVVGPSAVVRVSGDDVPELAQGQPVVVSAVGDGPFLAHAWLRVGARGVPVTRALASAAGVPISMGPGTPPIGSTRPDARP